MINLDSSADEQIGDDEENFRDINEIKYERNKINKSSKTVSKKLYSKKGKKKDSSFSETRGQNDEEEEEDDDDEDLDAAKVVTNPKDIMMNLKT